MLQCPQPVGISDRLRFALARTLRKNHCMFSSKRLYLLLQNTVCFTPKTLYLSVRNTVCFTPKSLYLSDQKTVSFGRKDTIFLAETSKDLKRMRSARARTLAKQEAVYLNLHFRHVDFVVNEFGAKKVLRFLCPFPFFIEPAGISDRIRFALNYPFFVCYYISK